MDKVQVGKVTTAKRARLHLDIDGRARCGSGKGHIIPTTGHPVRPIDEPLICRHCLPHLRVAVAEAQAVAVAAPINRYREDEVRRLVCLADAFEPADEKAEMDELAARVAATIEAAAGVLAQSVNARPRTWATLRDEFAVTHPQPSLFAA